jgi:hypothetical protein
MKRTALRVLIGSVVFSALLGIWALLSGEFGEIQGKVMGTSLSISGASILAMIAGAAWTRSPYPPLPRIGMTLGLLGFGLLIVMMWVEARDETAWKSLGTLLLLAGATAHATLLSLARLRPSHAWLFPAAYVSCAAVSLLVLIGMWGEVEDTTLWRWVGVFSILLCAFTILVPVFQRIGREAPGADGEGTSTGAVRFCPGCGARVEPLSLPGDLVCGTCGETWRLVEVEPGSRRG